MVGLPDFLFGDGGAPLHLARELGSFDLALAVGFLFTAWRPIRAYGLLPLAAALAAGMALTSAVDVAEGRAAALSESAHQLELLGVVLVWQLARHAPTSSGRFVRRTA
jgi:predicted anti-sigma-YlaC factor YlaD